MCMVLSSHLLYGITKHAKAFDDDQKIAKSPNRPRQCERDRSINVHERTSTHVLGCAFRAHCFTGFYQAMDFHASYPCHNFNHVTSPRVFLSFHLKMLRAASCEGGYCVRQTSILGHVVC